MGVRLQMPLITLNKLNPSWALCRLFDYPLISRALTAPTDLLHLRNRKPTEPPLRHCFIGTCYGNTESDHRRTDKKKVKSFLLRNNSTHFSLPNFRSVTSSYNTPKWECGSLFSWSTSAWESFSTLYRILYSGGGGEQRVTAKHYSLSMNWLIKI